MLTRLIKKTALLLLLGYAVSSQAVLDIYITQGIERALPIAVIPFGWSGDRSAAPVDFADIISSDLGYSGQFNVMDKEDLPQQPHEYTMISFDDWRKLGMEHIIIGEIKHHSEDTYEVNFRLIDIYRNNQIAGFQVTTKRKQLRKTAHQIADIVFEKLTGIKGIFATQIAYVTVQKRQGETHYMLQIADADGYNPKTLLKSTEPLLSPNWSPDGEKLAYVSFEKKNAVIYIQHIASGMREQVSGYPGINSAPAWSPDGSRLAITLSKEGNPEIYLLHLDSKSLQRITHHPAIDTEPSWSVNGDQLVFTSDRSGSAQIYTINIAGGKATRLTFTGAYNAHPVYSPDGKYLAMVHGANNAYRIAVMDLQGKYLSILTDTKLDESPSFSPNGNQIIYTTSSAAGTQLATVSIDGRIRRQLQAQKGRSREPSWGPFFSR